MESIERQNETIGLATEEATVKHLKRQANLAFINGQMYEAIQGYSDVLKITPQDPEILSNRGAAFMRVKNYQKAKDDLCQCMKFETEPNIKSIGRMAKAIWGLQQYDEALGFLEGIIERNSNPSKTYIQEILNLIATSRSLKNEDITGEYNMKELLKKQQQNYDCAEYVGPVSIENVPGKGRGLVATENIRSGQVLLGTKAFAVVFPDLKSHVTPMSKLIMVNQDGNEYMEDSKHSKLVSIIADILKTNLKARKEFYKLYAGPKLHYMDKDQEDAIEGCITEQDLDRINHICYYNGMFWASNPNPKQVPNPNVVDEIRNANTYGVWLLPSYLNHSCVDINCDAQKYGDFFILRAMKNITKGEELLISYVVPTKPFLERNVDLEGYGIQCRCQLCQLEENESQEVHRQRVELMKLFLQTCTTSNYDPKPIESIQSQLEALRPHHPEINFPLFWINRQLGYCQKNMLDFENAAKSFAASYQLSKCTCLRREGIRFALHTALCFASARNIKKARDWISILNVELRTTYGTLDVREDIAIREGIPAATMTQIMKKYDSDTK